MAANVRLLLGPVQSGKTTRLLGRYRDFLRSDASGVLSDRGLWIGPTRQAVVQVRDALAASAEDGFLDPAMLTFAGFAESIIASSGRLIRPISRLQKRRILHAVAGQAVEEGRLEHFSPVAQTAGFLAQLDELIAELKRRDIWPKDFYQSGRQKSDRELAVVYDLYQRHLLAHDLYDAEGRFWAAREALSQPPDQTKDVAYGLVVVDGFDDFTESQYDILQSLANRAKAVQISLTLDPEALEFADRSDGRAVLLAKTKATYERLRQVFPQMAVETSPTPFFAVASLKHLERNLFRDPHKLGCFQESPQGIEILAANSLQGEIEGIARKIKTLLRTHQTSPQEIVVVFRHLEEVARRVGEVFDDYGIPYALGASQPLAASPLVRSVTTALRLHAEDWPFRQLLDVVGNRLFRLLDTESDAKRGWDARAAMEHCVRVAQIPSGKRALLEQLERWTTVASSQQELSGEKDNSADAKKGELASKAAVAFDKLQQVATHLEALPQQAPLARWVELLQQLAVGLGLLPREDRDKVSPDIAASWSRLRGGLRSLEQIEGWISANEQQYTISELIDLIQAVAADERLPAVQDAVGRVRILSAETGRHVAAKHVFLAGLSEQAFSSQGHENRLYDVQSVRLLGRPSAEADQGNASQERRLGEAMFLFYQLATRATESLTLSYPAMDEKGQTLPPSPLLTELERCFGEVALPRGTTSWGESVSSTTSPDSRSEYRQQAVARALGGDHKWLAGLVSEPSGAESGNAILAGIESIGNRSARDTFGAYDGLLLSPAARKSLAQRFDAKHLWSPSQLESYATCAFRFFSEQLLSLEPPGELALRSDPRRKGSLLHHVLATLHEQLRDAEIEMASADAASAELIERFRRALAEAVAAAPLYGLQHSLREIERREIETLAPAYAQQETDYRARWNTLDEPPKPTHFEVRFGPQTRSGAAAKSSDASTPLPFELDLGDEKILLTGQIDRVDVGRVGGVTVFNVIDYKSGKEVKLQFDKIRSGQQLQLPLYALAAEHLLLADRGAVALATGYWSIVGRGFRSGRSGALEVRQLVGRKLQTSEQWEQLQAELFQRIRQLVEGIRDGQFPVYNQDEHCTRWCPFSTICRVAQIRSLEKRWNE